MSNTMTTSAVVTATISNHTNGNVVSDMPSTSNAVATAARSHKKKTPSRYRHVAAVHFEARPSCLSHDSQQAPSFLGFRNLMIIVLSKCEFIFTGQISFDERDSRIRLTLISLKS